MPSLNSFPLRGQWSINPPATGTDTATAFTMSLEIAISPGGRLSLQRAMELGPAVNKKWTARLQGAFDVSAADGILVLATDALTLSVPPSLIYWRDFGRVYLQTLCRTGGVDGGPVPLTSFARSELWEFTLEAPPMRGGEFLTSELLERLLQELGALVIRESAATGGRSRRTAEH